MSLARLELIRRRLALAPAAGLLAPYESFAMIQSSTIAGTAAVPTGSASRYLQQICKHWSHNLEVAFTPDHGTIRFPREGRAGTFPGDALVTLDAHETTLDVRIDASVPEQLEAMKGVIARHLDRFAFREAPLTFDWR